jgi:hypothetical protein
MNMKYNQGFVMAAAAALIVAASVSLFFFSKWHKKAVAPEQKDMPAQTTETTKNTGSDDASIDALTAEIDAAITAQERDNSEVDQSFTEQSSTQ